MVSMAKMVSIIVPVYNVEQYLERMIVSILVQTYPHFELILVDDGSTDSSLGICKKITDTRIRVIEQKNAGVSVARNNGMNHAKGDYIIFVDSDDSVEPDMLEKLMNIPLEDNELIIYGYYIHDLEKNDEITKNVGNSQARELTPKTIATNFWTYYSQGLINSPCNKLYRTAIIRENDILFPEGVKMGEDLLFNLTYFDHIHRFKIIDQYFYHYYLYETQSSRKVHLGIVDDMIRFLTKIESFLKNKKVDLTEHNNQIVKHLITAMTMPYRKMDISNRERLTYLEETVQKFKKAFPAILLSAGNPYEKTMFYLAKNDNYKTMHTLLLLKETTKIRLKKFIKK